LGWKIIGMYQIIRKIKIAYKTKQNKTKQKTKQKTKKQNKTKQK